MSKICGHLKVVIPEDRIVCGCNRFQTPAPAVRPRGLCDRCPFFDIPNYPKEVEDELRAASPPPIPKPVMRGLGDWIALKLYQIGIAKKPGCNCGDRQKLLNKWFPFK